MLDAAEAIALARKETGLESFGDDDLLRRLTNTMEGIHRAPLNPEAREGLEKQIVGELAMRLRIEDYIARNPEVLDAKVEGPLLVTGFPRTGTTATVSMLALDKQFRFLRAWEGKSPLPPPQIDTEQDDPRAVAARQAASMMDQSIHLSDPDGPEEDLAMMSGFDVRNYLGMYPMPDDFIEAWIAEDFRPFYAFHSKLLRILHSRRPPRRWLIKAPPHIFRIEEFFAEYPDARVIMTHRNPAQVIASDASFRYYLNSTVGDVSKLPAKETYGPRLLDFWMRGLERALEARKRIGEDRFVDVRNADVISQPIATFERTYAALGMDFTDETRTAIEAYLDHNRQGAHGSHDYTAEEYGLTDAMVRERFAEYCERFGV